jgi:glycine cleavage system aminomethyltransferase T
MSAPAPAPLKRTPLFSLHREVGAKMVDFGGWEMPVHYEGILEEHRAVRERVGLSVVPRSSPAPVTRERTVPSGAQTVGTEFEVDIRGRRARARIVETPFYKRKKEASA